jgi:hypothetical protein
VIDGRCGCSHGHWAFALTDMAAPPVLVRAERGASTAVVRGKVDTIIPNDPALAALAAAAAAE